jgi:hypothetical protein
MFIGHFAVGFAAKRAQPAVSLGTLFIAAQWLDLLWPILLLLGFEKVEVASGSNPVVPLSFVHYPYSHGLVAVMGWSVLAGLLYWFVNRNGKAAVTIALCVLSHWVLDLLVHDPDLPLVMDSSSKLGLGLWNHKLIALFVESLIFILGVFLYFRATTSQSKGNRIALWTLVLFLYAIQIANFYGPAPTDMKAVAWAGMLQWIFVVWAYLVDRNRTVRRASS